MKSAYCIQRGLSACLTLAAGLGMAGVAAAQAPGMVHTGANGGIGRNGADVGSYDTRKVPPAVRVVQGAVLDKTGVPVKGAMVYLKDDKTSQIRSMLVDENGKYRFMALSFTADYKLWAQSKEKKSDERPISSMDTKSELNRDLKIE